MYLLHSHSEMNNPLYNSAPLTAEESMYVTYLYAITVATSHLLDLMRIHLPAPNSYPSSFYALKKHISGMSTLTLRKFCSTCLCEVQREQALQQKRMQAFCSLPLRYTPLSKTPGGYLFRCVHLQPFLRTSYVIFRCHFR